MGMRSRASSGATRWRCFHALLKPAYKRFATQPQRSSARFGSPLTKLNASLQKTTHMAFLRNTWYVAAWTTEIGEPLFHRTLLGEPVLMFRRENGDVTAMLDRCPH